MYFMVKLTGPAGGLDDERKRKKQSQEGLPSWSSSEDTMLPLQGYGFNPWLGNYDPECHATQLPKKGGEKRVESRKSPL